MKNNSNGFIGIRFLHVVGSTNFYIAVLLVTALKLINNIMTNEPYIAWASWLCIIFGNFSRSLDIFSRKGREIIIS
jgi:hypothetical protein